MQSARQEVESTGSRSERIRTYNYADDRVTDHRLEGSKFGISRMLDGEMLNELAEELAAQSVVARRAAFLRGLDAKG